MTAPSPVAAGGVRAMIPADLEAVCTVHLDAFKGSMNTRLGRAYVRSFLRWFVEAPEAAAFVATYGGAIAGYAVGAPDGYQRDLNRTVVVSALAGMLAHPWVLVDPRVLRTSFARVRSLVGLKPAGSTLTLPSGPRMSLVGIGVASTARGLGLGTLLIRAIEDAARAAGMRAVTLTVYRDNIAAIHAYKRAGWRDLGAASPKAVCYGREL